MDININEVKTITQAMTMPVTSLALVGNFLAVMKPKLMEEADLESFPVLVLYGQPKTGKSAVFKSAIPDKEDIKSTADGYRKVNNYIKEKEVEYMLIDDVANTDSYAKRQRYARIADDIGRSAYQGDICVIGMTIEEGTLGFFPESGVQRMLIVSTDGFWTRENQKFVRKLRKCKKTLAKIIMEFRTWFAEQRTSFEDDLEMYEIIHEDVMEYDTRVVHNTFAYFITLIYCFKFLEEVFPDVCIGLNIDVAEVIKNLVKPHFIMQKSEEMKRSEEFGYCYDTVLKSHALVAQKPIPEEVICKDYAFGKCEDCPGTYNFACSNTYFKMHKKYDAESLVIRNNYNCLFLEDARNMIVFPKYLEKQGKQPVLLINKDILHELINHILLENWKEKKEKTPLIRFGWAEVTDFLLDTNRIMFFPEANGKLRYSIPHYCEVKDEDGEIKFESTSVVVLRLTESEARMFDEKTDYFNSYSRQHAYAKAMGNRLSKYWFSLVAYGKIDDIFGA